MTVAITKASHAGVHARLVGMALLWGASWPAGKILAQAIHPIAASAWRFTFASALLLAWLWQRHGGFPALSRRQWYGLALGGAVGVFGYGVFFMYGLKLVPASRAAIVVTVNPVFTTLIAAWLFGERFNWKIGVGMACATLGAAIVLTQGAPWKLFVGDIGFGELLLLGCVATWVGYTLIGKALLSGIDVVTATTTSALSGLLLLWLTVLGSTGADAVSSLLHLNLRAWIALLFLAAGATVLAYVWYYEGIAKLGAGTASSYISLVPVFGVLSAAAVLGEPIDLSLVLGGTLAVTGVVWMNRARS
jgi:drug/metabolite transporter (DMT)-like permease